MAAPQTTNNKPAGSAQDPMNGKGVTRILAKYIVDGKYGIRHGQSAKRGCELCSIGLASLSVAAIMKPWTTPLPRLLPFPDPPKPPFWDAANASIS